MRDKITYHLIFSGKCGITIHLYTIFLIQFW